MSIFNDYDTYLCGFCATIATLDWKTGSFDSDDKFAPEIIHK